MKTAAETQNLVDDIFGELESVTEFVIEIRYRDVVFNCKTKPKVEIISVNGFTSLKDFQVYLARLFQAIFGKTREVMYDHDSNDGGLFLREVIVRGLELIKSGEGMLEMNRTVNSKVKAGIPMFRDGVVLIGGVETHDLFLIFNARREAMAYARMWFVGMQAMRSFWDCQLCLCWPLHPDFPVCKIPFSNMFERISCPTMFLLSTLFMENLTEEERKSGVKALMS